MLIFFGIGIVLVLLLHQALRFFAGLSSGRIQKLARFLTLAGWVVLLLVLLRFGQAPVAAIAAVLSLVLPWWQRQRTLLVPPSASMTRAEAANILGVAETASHEDIQQAYKRMMQKNHPDQGGSEALARLINEARDVLDS